MTLGSPLGDPKATNAWRLYEALSGSSVDETAIRRRIESIREPLRDVPVTAVYSKSDAIVSWKIAKLPRSEMAENVRVRTSHIGMGFNPVVLYLIADRLRQPEGAWEPFEISGVRSYFYY